MWNRDAVSSARFTSFRERIPLINSWLLAGVFFTIPIHAAEANILSGLMLLLWLIEGRFKEKWERLSGNPVFWIFSAYLAVIMLSLLWSEDLGWGWEMVARHVYFMFFPVYLTVVRREHIKFYISAFLLSVSITEILAYYNWTRMHFAPWLPEGVRSREDAMEIAPFVDHIMYSPIFAFGAYLVGHALIFQQMPVWRRVLFSVFLLTITTNIFIAGGRAGQVGMLAMMGLLVMQRFWRRPLLASSLAGMLVATLFLAGYQSSNAFEQRVDAAVYEIVHYQSTPNASASNRINFAVNTLRIIRENMWLGVGVGDFPKEYEVVNQVYTPGWVSTVNPHNQFLLSAVSVGFGGLLLLILVFLGPVYLSRHVHDDLQKMRVGLVVLFSIICLSESYLFRSNTSLMFILFSAAFYSTTRLQKEGGAQFFAAVKAA